MLNDEPSTAFFPSTLKVLNEVSLENSLEGEATFNVTVWVLVATPFSAVTTTVKVFVPVTSPVAPVITALAFVSVGSATTVTEVTPFASSTVAPLTTSVPLTEKTPRDASLFAATFSVTV